MNNIKILLGLEIKRQLSSYSKKGKAIEILLYILLLFSSLWMGVLLPMIIISTSSDFSDDIGFKEILLSGYGDGLINFHGIIVFLVAAIFGFLSLKTVFFNRNDQDTLWALPLEKKEILLSKFLGIMIPYILPILLFCFPTVFIVYHMFDNLTSPLVFLLNSFSTIFLGLSLGMILRLIILKIFPYEDLPKWAKSLLGLTFMSVFLFFYFLEISRNFSDIGNFLKNNSGSLSLMIINSSITRGNYLLFLGLLLLAILSSYLLFHLLENAYITNALLNPTKIKSGKLGDKDYKVSSPLKALVRKEISLYWSNSAVVTNTFVSAFFLLFLSGATLLPSLQESFFKFFENFGNFSKDTLMFFALIFITGTMNISTFGFSLESKMAYNTYSLPLRGDQIFLGKLLSSLIQLFPIFLLSYLIIMVSIKPSPAYAPLLFFGPLAYICLNNAIGLLFDMKFANYLWDDPKQLAKQSKQAFFSGLGNLLLSLIIILIGCQMLALYPYLSCLLITLLLVLSNFIFFLLLRGVKVYHI